jgi:hypothetical protein
VPYTLCMGYRRVWRLGEEDSPLELTKLRGTGITARLLSPVSLHRWLFRYILTFLRDGMLPENRRLLVQVRRTH